MKKEDNSGWILLHRRLQEHWIYPQNRKFTPYEAWIDLLLIVNHDDQEVDIKNSIMICKRGESLRSLETLSMRWNWNKSATRRFLKKLEKAKMIVLESLPKTTRITVCNYDKYQPKRNANETDMKRKRNGHETQANLNNELYKLKEYYDSEIEKSQSDPEYLKIVKALFGENNLGVPLNSVLKMETQLSFEHFRQIQSYKKKYNFSTIQILESIENWGNPKKYKTVYGTFRTFLKNELNVKTL
ncbi:MAG TPA: hypothetical protein VHO50_07155 [Bacteroidales bacterium]|nr:hypothetical protein [Bacteroidales bacterium]